MKMTYSLSAHDGWLSSLGDVTITKTTAKTVLVKCGSITLRLKHSEIVKGAKIIRSGNQEGFDYYIVITVEEDKKK